MQTIRRQDLGKTIDVNHRLGYACPRCLLETWATSDWATSDNEVKGGWCTSCAFSGEPLKIIEQIRKKE